MEQENPADAARSPGTKKLLLCSNYFENIFLVNCKLVVLIKL